jgi:hypothetical protein
MTGVLEISPGQVHLPVLEIPDFGTNLPKTSSTFVANGPARPMNFIVAGPTPPKPFWARLVVTSMDGSTEHVLENVFLEGELKDGVLAYANDRQKIAVSVQLSLNLGNNRLRFGFAARLAGSLARQCLEALRVQEILESGGSLSVFLRNDVFPTEEHLFETHFPKGEVSTQTRQGIAILENLVTIERKIGTLFHLPLRDLPVEEIRAIHETAQIVTTGDLIQSANGVTLQGNREFVENTLKYCKPDTPFRLSGDFDVNVSLLGKTVSLGKTLMQCENAFLTTEDFQELQKVHGELQDDEEISIHFRVSEDGKVHWTYPEWKEKRDLPPDVEKEALRERISKVVGKYSSILSSSDEFAARKNEEFDIEQRRYAESEA